MGTVIRNVTAATWAGLTLGSQTAGNLGVGSIGGTWTLTESAGKRWLVPSSTPNIRFTTFGGATDPMTGGATVGVQTLRWEFAADMATFATTNNDEPLRLTIGTGNRFVSFRVVNRDGNQKGIRIFIGATSATDNNQLGSINDANAGLPVLEFNREYDITVRLDYSATGSMTLYIDGQYAGRVTGDFTADTSLNSSNQYRNWNWEPYKSGTNAGLTVRLHSAGLHTDGADWYNDHFPVSPTTIRPDAISFNSAVAETDFPSVWSAQPLPSNGTPIDGHELGMSLLSGTPTVAVTGFSAAGLDPRKSRLVFSSASAGNTVLVYGTDRRGGAGDIGNVPDLANWRTLCFTTEYHQNNSSAIYAIYAPGTTAAQMATATPLLAVRVVGVASKIGFLCEGTTTFGRRLCSIDPNKRYTIALQWNQVTGETRVIVIDLTSAQPADAGTAYNVALLGQPLLYSKRLAQTWPTGTSAGPWGVRYILGGSASEGLSTVTAGPMSLVFGDSYVADRVQQSSGPDVFVSPVLTALANNFFTDMSNGYLAQMHRRGFRPSKIWGGRDIVWLSTIARSGGAIENMADATVDEIGNVRGSYGLICGYAYNSIGSIDAATAETVLSRIVEKTALLISNWIVRDNVMYYITPPALRASAVGGDITTTSFNRASAQRTIPAIGPRVLAAVKALVPEDALRNLMYADSTDISNMWMQDSSDSFHPTGATFGNRTYVASLFPGQAMNGARSMFLPAVEALESIGTLGNGYSR